MSRPNSAGPFRDQSRSKSFLSPRGGASRHLQTLQRETGPEGKFRHVPQGESAFRSRTDPIAGPRNALFLGDRHTRLDRSSAARRGSTCRRTPQSSPMPARERGETAAGNGDHGAEGEAAGEARRILMLILIIRASSGFQHASKAQTPGPVVVEPGPPKRAGTADR